MKFKCITPINPIFIMFGLSFKAFFSIAPIFLILLIIYRKRKKKDVKKLTIATVFILILSLAYWTTFFVIDSAKSIEYRNTDRLDLPKAVTLSPDCGGKDIVDYLF